MTFNVAIIGAGLLGRKRGLALNTDPDVRITHIADVNVEVAQKLATELKAGQATESWQSLVRSPDVHAVIITTPNFLHAPIGIEALKNNKHVLCEKPLTTVVSDAKQMVQLAKQNQLVLKTGFNHRHFPHIQKAKEIFDTGRIGKIYFIRAHYGHGGRAGYDKEWRGDVKLAGGGQLMDQGVHIIDLCRWFLGDFFEAQGVTRNYHWGSDTIEDNSFFTLSTRAGQVVQAHVSWTQWKNDFSFEVFGDCGYLRLSGLTGYYGQARLVVGVKTTKSVVPEEEIFEYNQEDKSFSEEWRCFRQAILCKSDVMANGHDGLEVLKTVLAVYQSHKTGKKVLL